MKKSILIILLFIVSVYSFSQSDAIVKQLGSGITVRFPNNPTYQEKDKAGVYITATENNMFTVIVKYDVLPYYSEFLKLSEKDQEKGIDVFLDNAIKGILKASGNENSPHNKIQVGNHKGRETSYAAINPITGEIAMHYVKMLYCYNKLYLFQCMQLEDNSTSVSERKIFLNSISTK